LSNPITIIRSIGVANQRYKRLFLSIDGATHIRRDFNASDDNNILTFYFSFPLRVARFIVIILHFVRVPRRARYS